MASSKMPAGIIAAPNDTLTDLIGQYFSGDKIAWYKDLVAVPAAFLFFGGNGLPPGPGLATWWKLSRHNSKLLHIQRYVAITAYAMEVWADPHPAKALINELLVDLGDVISGR